jgi:serine phosphatase RsbU (regulator of sigma subunit)
MVLPGNPATRIAALERALQVEKAAAIELRKLLEARTRELELARERSRRQARLVGARTAIAILAQHGTLERAAPRMLEAIGQELEWQVVHLLMLDPATQTLRCRFQWCAQQIKGADALAAHTFAPGIGVPGRVWTTSKPAWVADIAKEASGPGRHIAGEAGLQSACGFPIVVDGSVHAVIELFASEVREPDDELLVTFGALGSQIGQWIEQSRTQDQLRFNELQIARHIQTAILPRDLVVDGLEVAAMMVPATEVGGDYYDVLPFTGGAWFGIGDVTGHGVAAGMIMLMVQSTVAALTRDAGCESPQDVVVRLNALLHENIRRRLREQDHVTFSLLRYTRDGVVRFAGAHEDVIIWRASERRCEVVETAGLWLGAIPSVATATEDHELQLEPGDILVLYTDGLTEARNAAREQFGLQRLCDAVAELASVGPNRSTAQMCDDIIGRAMRWCATQDDDISLVIARYHGDELAYEIEPDHTVMQAGEL